MRSEDYDINGGYGIRMPKIKNIEDGLVIDDIELEVSKFDREQAIRDAKNNITQAMVSLKAWSIEPNETQELIELIHDLRVSIIQATKPPKEYITEKDMEI